MYSFRELEAELHKRHKVSLLLINLKREDVNVKRNLKNRSQGTVLELAIKIVSESSLVGSRQYGKSLGPVYYTTS